MLSNTARRFVSTQISNGTSSSARSILSCATAPTVIKTSSSLSSRRYSSSSSSSNSRNGGPVSRGQPFKRKSKTMEVSTHGAPVVVAPIEVAEPRDPSLPFVPTTGYLDHGDVAISSFFALHRPVSVSFPVPGEYNSSTFSSIFDDLTLSSLHDQERRQAEIQHKVPGNAKFISLMKTLSEGTTSVFSHAEIRALEQASRQANPQVPVQVPDHVINGRWPHFTPPPAPKPIPNWHINVSYNKWYIKTKMVEERLHQMRKVSKKRTPEERLERYMRVQRIKDAQSLAEPNNIIRIQRRNNAQSLIEIELEPMSSIRDLPYAMRMAWRRRVFYEKKRPLIIIRALSTKRQRKLKMKKHKYKKLMKKTRSIRRRLEKQ